ncbi:hypothetical protein P280DRAFT_464669 [Massarina eburnea CBS 473.64]|uniref:F-box domain-containing protein n=1 Tax=Massarina eburnea CBS 473.64 TaxID=1395130 RepID=A0A6A6SEW7_9PLEO|nr:hypothetical protein P280DRAFT_464669 [Massarina eburnea CBS 473.64]
MSSQQPAPTAAATSSSPIFGLSSPPIWKLPDELLLCIAAKLARNTDLRRLSLVNKKLKGIAQEALVKEVLMPPNGIIKLLDTLCGRSDLAKKVKSVDLGDYQFPAVRSPTGGINDERLSIFNLDKSSLFRRLRSSIDETNGEGLFARIIAAIGKEQGAIWTPSHQYFLDILIALSPSLKELTIRLPERPGDPVQLLLLHSFLNSDSSPTLDLVDPFQGPALQLLRERLRVLTLSSATFKSLRTHNVTLRSMSQLVRLSIPMDALIFPTLEATDPVKALPSSLECIRIRPCNNNLVRWIPELASAFSNREFPKLQRLEMVFQSCLRSSLILIGHGTGVLAAFRNVMYRLRDNGLSFVTFRLDGTSAGDMIEELDAWSCLSDSESWWAATKGMQFSETVARNDAGAPRKRTPAEIRFFIRGTHQRTRLRRICRFGPEGSWDETTITFGKDKKPKVDEKKCVFDRGEWEKVLSAYKLSSTPDFLMQDVGSGPLNGPSPQQVQELLHSAYNPTVYSWSFDPSRSNPTASTFDDNEWSGQEFFSKEMVIDSDLMASPRPKKRIRPTNIPAPNRRRSRTPPARHMKQKVQ